MDWAKVIERTAKCSRASLRNFSPCWGWTMAHVSQIPHPLHRAVLRVLRPAESAVRRLIVIAARGLVVKLAPPRPDSRPKPAKLIGKGSGSSRPPSFQLFDPRKRFKPVRAMKSTGVSRASVSSPTTRSHGCSHICSARCARSPPRRSAARPPMA